MDDLDFEYFNEEQEFQTLGNPVRSNTPWNAATASPARALAPPDQQDASMLDPPTAAKRPQEPIQIDSDVSESKSKTSDEDMQDLATPLPMQGFAHVLQELETTPTPDVYLQNYPGTVESIRVHFEQWYESVPQEPFFPTKEAQLQMITTSCTAFHIDTENFFPQVRTYEAAAYYLSKAWIWLRKEDIATTLHIPFTYTDYLDKQLYQQHEESWFRDDDRIVDSSMTMAFIAHDAIDLNMGFEERANEIAAGTLQDLVARQHAHLQTQLDHQSAPNFLADNFPILRPQAEDEPG
jgi:hypothetical protein